MDFFKKMNLPNKLTMIRVFLIPFFVVFMCLSVKDGDIATLRATAPDGFVLLRWLSLIVFAVASLTDLLDGKIARKYNLVTNFGKFMDPLADKLLVCSALILFSAEGSLPGWVTVIIIARELTIGGFRTLAVERGVVIAAGWWGKVKTNFQMILCIYLILPTLSYKIGPTVTWILIGIAAALTVISLVDYIVKNKSVLSEGGN